MMGLGVGNAAKHKLVGTLATKLAGDGVYVTEIMVSGVIKGTSVDQGHMPAIEGSRVAEKYWELYTGRSELRRQSSRNHVNIPRLSVRTIEVEARDQTTVEEKVSPTCRSSRRWGGPGTVEETPTRSPWCGRARRSTNARQPLVPAPLWESPSQPGPYLGARQAATFRPWCAVTKRGPSRDAATVSLLAALL
jgi:hypothetical protein